VSEKESAEARENERERLRRRGRTGTLSRGMPMKWPRALATVERSGEWSARWPVDSSMCSMISSDCALVRSGQVNGLALPGPQTRLCTFHICPGHSTSQLGQLGEVRDAGGDEERD